MSSALLTVPPTDAVVAKRRVLKLVPDSDAGSEAMKQALIAMEKAIRTEEQVRGMTSRVAALEQGQNSIITALTDVRLEIGKIGVKMGMWGALGAVVGAALASIIAGLIVWYVTKGAVHPQEVGK